MNDVEKQLEKRKKELAPIQKLSHDLDLSELDHIVMVQMALDGEGEELTEFQKYMLPYYFADTIRERNAYRKAYKELLDEIHTLHEEIDIVSDSMNISWNEIISLEKDDEDYNGRKPNCHESIGGQVYA